MINAKPEMRINGIDLILDQESTNERWKAMHDGKQVAEIRLVAGELGVQYPVGAGGDIHQAMVVASVNTFDCDRRREEHLTICVCKIRERMLNDGSLEFEEVTFDQMDGKVIKHVRPPWITSTDGFICHIGI